MKIRKLLKNIFSSEDGFVLPIALALLMIGSLLVIPSSALTQTALIANITTDEITKSTYAADAGVEYALWQIANNNDSLVFPEIGQQVAVPFSDVVNQKEVALAISNIDGTRFTVTADATGGSGHDVTITAGLDITFQNTSEFSPFEFALASLDGDIELWGSTGVESDVVQEGDVYANGSVFLEGMAAVYGDASATGTITVGATAYLEGSQSPSAEPLARPNIDNLLVDCETEVLSASCVPITHTNLTITGNGNYFYADPIHTSGYMSILRTGTHTFAQTVCVDGDLTIGAGVSVIFQAPVKVGGIVQINTSGSVTFNSTVYVGSDFITNGDATINLGGTVYIKGNVLMDGEAAASFSGGHTMIVEGDITLTGSSQLSAEEIPFIISPTGNITVAGENWTSAILFAPYGVVTLTGSAQLYGCGVGESIDGSGESHVVYPIDLRNRLLPIGEGPGAIFSGFTMRTYTIE
jgi:hypothetical protein